MTREQEFAFKALLRGALTPALIAFIDRPSKEDGIEAIMDRLWADKAALGELLRRGHYDKT